MTVSVVIPTIPPRARKLRQAFGSVVMQTLQPDEIIVSYDHDRTGAAATKNRGIARATSQYVAMLDDDDQFLPEHLETLVNEAGRAGADVVYSIPVVPQRADKRDPHGRYGVPFDAAELRRRSYIPTTSLFRRELLESVGGFQYPAGSIYDDWGCYLALLDAGATFVHVPAVTWIWNHHGANTSGQSDRW